MSALTIHNIPDTVHDALRKLAAKRGVSVEALARSALEEVAKGARGGIDFELLERERAALGLIGDGPEWPEALDDPALSRRVLGLD
ncbi:MAG: hypothetical protein NVV62_09445 [Terricaulis sp.]|nr:hypothetical protein [Terricaulis sp.]